MRTIEYFDDEGHAIGTERVMQDEAQLAAAVFARKQEDETLFRVRFDGAWYGVEDDGRLTPIPKELDDPSWSQEVPIPSFAIQMTKRQAD
jgi:hypothetical protein